MLKSPPPAVNSPLQEATAIGFERASELSFFPTQVREYAERLAVITAALDEVGLPYTVPDGAYFVLVQNERIRIPEGFEIGELVKDRPKGTLS